MIRSASLPWTDDPIKFFFPGRLPVSSVKPAPLTGLSLKTSNPISCGAPGEAPLDTGPFQPSPHTVHLIVHAAVPIIVRNSPTATSPSSSSIGGWRAFSRRTVGSETGVAVCSSLPSSGLFFAHLEQNKVKIKQIKTQNDPIRIRILPASDLKETGISQQKVFRTGPSLLGV